MKIAVAGAGYVGMSLAVLLAQNHSITLLDVCEDKCQLINQKKSPIRDTEIEDFLQHKKLDLQATTDWRAAIKDAKFVIVAVPTNYNEDRNFFDTSKVEDVIEKVLQVQAKHPQQKTTIVIKSTIPIGYIDSIRQHYKIRDIFFSPEFLREGQALHDNLYPSRIIIGDHSKTAHQFANLLLEGAAQKDTVVKFVGTVEAESIKLFANTYLAVRVAYFNELDIYAEAKGLNAKDIIDSICLDPRVGNYYNNPSFGYGGYCLPKDTKQLRSNFQDIPQTMMTAVVEANELRKKHVAKMITKKNPRTVGVYRLIMKNNSDNFRASAVWDVIKLLQDAGINIIIYEPTITESFFHNIQIDNNLEHFKGSSDIIIANRMDEPLKDVGTKLYTRDIYTRD